MSSLGPSRRQPMRVGGRREGSTIAQISETLLSNPEAEMNIERYLIPRTPSGRRRRRLESSSRACLRDTVAGRRSLARSRDE